MRRIVLIPLLFALALPSCGGDEPAAPDPAPKLGPASVVVRSATLSVGAIYHETVTATLENTGGPGTFRLEAWGLPTSPNGPDTLYCESEPYDVPADWSEAASWECETGSTGDNPRIKWLILLTRDEGSVQYRETDRHDF